MVEVVGLAEDPLGPEQATWHRGHHLGWASGISSNDLRKHRCALVHKRGLIMV